MIRTKSQVGLAIEKGINVVLLGTCSSSRVLVPKRELEIASLPEPAPEVSAHWNILEELRGGSALLQVLQEDELLLLLLRLCGITRLSRQLSQRRFVRSFGVCCVAEEWLHRRAAGWCRATGHNFLCVAESGAAVLVHWSEEQAGRDAVFSHLLLRKFKPWNAFRKCLEIIFLHPQKNALMLF